MQSLLSKIMTMVVIIFLSAIIYSIIISAIHYQNRREQLQEDIEELREMITIEINNQL